MLGRRRRRGVDADGHGLGHGLSATTVSVTLAASASVAFLNVTEYADVTGVDPGADAAVATAGSSTAVSPGTVTPSAGGELVVGGAFVERATGTGLAGQLTPFLLLNQTSPDQGFGAYLVDPTATGIGFTYDQSAGGAWAALACALDLDG